MKTKQPVEKNKQYDVSIEDLTYQGLGVAKIENFPIFITNTLPGEKAKIVVTKVQKTYAFGRVLEVLQSSPDRVDGLGKEYTQTGIAPLQYLRYDAQLLFKQHQIENLLKKSHLNIHVDNTIGMDEPYGYRNKAQIPVRTVAEQLETGFFKRNSHDLVPIEDFRIQDTVIDDVIVKVRDILRANQVVPYEEVNHQGIIRNVMVRRGRKSGEIMVVLITNKEQFPNSDQVFNEIAAINNVVSVYQNINNRVTNVMMGDKNILKSGSPVIHDQLLGINFIISPSSFYQVNPVQTEKLYQLAIDKAGLTGNETVLDLYCGIGTISLAMAKHAKRVMGVEVVPEAIHDAKMNAQSNGIDNVEFVINKAEDQMKLWAENEIKTDLVVVDPPRKGLAGSVIESIGELQPKKVVYVSCNPATLVRDIGLFEEQGYEVDGSIIPVDQFPQTPHVESVTVLSLK
ncbi:23S rRNA (uracil(1939)-C(5))-methyltransferase RlmD [Pediococcus claussenii]|uniref:23S rRNA (Uracil-5-)-methyltransferase RumA n=1 Tax=Pediococcus claussenii (strain ATCC BAA-344 / DSM 14800 / JCM 18046 / KCTC 3811 / LMG 21948 / P06) TaxID=701521 RepID=G8PE09_PEDCP|nr:23S rRNA (uracil(1939)-C(5))-methyltransferase RlmD [Pediococcus claussenii]AEV95494.1 23S rRNA (uracil-5-)-methyltransferase RumA [Pediococcus claussenii ATCC BAA-344]ANZ69018.1 23S rRNA (uracil-5-)-methyltransferase RumA [Pediococcus claussenii]ANZ70834.1 23S rRNA (uracil-5-)-methyltransferase RumA [Pediococcus claussenii]KRN20271.1 rumA protein [Pediococcus claussenii]